MYHTCSLQDLVFIFVWQNCLIFTLTEKPDFNLIDFLVSLYFCLSCMSHRFFLKNLYDFSYSVFNEHSLNFRQGHLAFTKLLRYLNLFKYLRRSVISPKELFSFFLGSSGLEPPTSRLSGARSNQLSYEPPDCVRFQTRILFSLAVELSPGTFVCLSLSSSSDWR